MNLYTQNGGSFADFNKFSGALAAARDEALRLQERSSGDRLGIRLADVEDHDLQAEPCNDTGDGDLDTLQLNGATLNAFRASRTPMSAGCCRLLAWRRISWRRSWTGGSRRG
jgi:hypothetical protein